MNRSFLCPVCKDADAPVLEGADHFPFCSQSCKDRDLGGWLRDQYRIGTRRAGSDEIPDLADPAED